VNKCKTHVSCCTHLADLSEGRSIWPLSTNLCASCKIPPQTFQSSEAVTRFGDIDEFIGHDERVHEEFNNIWRCPNFCKVLKRDVTYNTSHFLTLSCSSSFAWHSHAVHMAPKPEAMNCRPTLQMVLSICILVPARVPTPPPGDVF
jgi:hypothetical protein